MLALLTLGLTTCLRILLLEQEQLVGFHVLNLCLLLALFCGLGAGASVRGTTGRHVLHASLSI